MLDILLIILAGLLAGLFIVAKACAGSSIPSPLSELDRDSGYSEWHI